MFALVSMAVVGSVTLTRMFENKFPSSEIDDPGIGCWSQAPPSVVTTVDVLVYVFYSRMVGMVRMGQYIQFVV
jgi:hypothetical protein